MGKKIKNSNFQFARPIITNMSFKVNNEYKADYETKYAFNIEKKIDKISDNQAIVEVRWFTEEKNGSINPKYDISLTMVSSFRWTNETKKEDVDKLLEYNAVSLLLSYMRPIVSVITSNSVEPLDIPYVNLLGE